MLAIRLFCAFLLALPGAAAVPAALDGETLQYAVNWPSGLSLGDGELQAKRVKGATPEVERWEFRFRLDAAVPGFQVKDRYRSLATSDFCGTEFSRETAHGARRSNETTTINPATGAATRTTKGGGSSTLQAPACVKDSLTFLYFLRSELIKGRMPPPQTVLSGAAYQIRVEYRGAQRISLAEAPVEADRVVVSVKGPASQNTLEVYFARDAVRTPLLVSLPLPTGLVRMELVR